MSAENRIPGKFVDVPKPDSEVLAAGKHPPPARQDCGAENSVRMSPHGANLASIRGIPQLRGVILTGGNDSCAFRREPSSNATVMSGQPEQLAVSIRIPH